MKRTNKVQDAKKRIDWKYVKTLTPLERTKYFSDFIVSLTEGPIENPITHTKGNRTYTIDAKYETVFDVAYREFENSYGTLRQVSDKDAVEMDLSYLEPLSSSERVEQLDKQIKMIDSFIFEPIDATLGQNGELVQDKKKVASKKSYLNYKTILERIKASEEIKSLNEKKSKSLKDFALFKRLAALKTRLAKLRNPYVGKRVCKREMKFKLFKSKKGRRVKVEPKPKYSLVRTAIAGTLTVSLLAGLAAAYVVGDRKNKSKATQLPESYAVASRSYEGETEEVRAYSTFASGPIEVRAYDSLAGVPDEIRVSDSFEFFSQFPGTGTIIEDRNDIIGVLEQLRKDLLAQKEAEEAEAEELRLDAEQERVEEEARTARATQMDAYITEYCSYLNVDPAKAINIARTLTEDYNTSFYDVIGGNYDLNNMETAALVFVYNLQRNKLAVDLSTFGEDKNSIKIPSDMITLSPTEDGQLLMRNGKSYSEFMGHIADLLGQDKTYLLSISYHETGRVTSKLARNKNNFGGLRSTGDFFSYASPEAGVIAFCMNLKGYEKYGLSSLTDLSGIYVNGSRSNPAPTWVSSVSALHREVMNNYDNLFGTPTEYVAYDSIDVQNVRTGEAEKVLVLIPVEESQPTE